MGCIFKFCKEITDRRNYNATGPLRKDSLLKNVSIVLIACLIIVVGWFAYSIWSSSSDSNQVIVKIPAGASFAEVLDTLTEAGLVSNSIAFRLLAVTTGSDGKIRPGTYKFTRGISNAALLNALVEGRSSVRMKVTFPEGSTIRRMAAILTREIGVDSAAFVRLANDRKFLETIGINASTAEGYLMPDTYFLYGASSRKRCWRGCRKPSAHSTPTT
ncbi:MAG: aminodeoxychorismate lyase [Chlorobi bacterium OLB7]|nr:MAG: aminodeoxychorismate lyase [Chlorobi bacterium OLB7]